MSEAPRVAAFRPDDGRLAAAEETLESLGVNPVGDPMLAVEATGESPRSDADFAVLTSVTGAELVGRADWAFDGTLCAIGASTASALRERGYEVDVVPEEFSSTGLVAALGDSVAGERVEIARSDHGSEALPEGLNAAGAFVHETTLYRLVRPPESGESAALAAAGELDGVLFTSSLTVSHFIAAAAERGVREAAIEGLDAAVVGAIGAPTAETAREHGISVDVIPDTADFEALAAATTKRLDAPDAR